MLECSLDWLEFTFISFLDHKDILVLLNFLPSEFIECKTSLYGYPYMIKHHEHNIYIMFGNPEKMGIHLRVAGHSLDFFFTNLGYDMVETIGYLSPYGHFTRLDVALDDIGVEYFSIPDLHFYLTHDRYSMKFKHYSFISMYHSDENKKCGDTIYLGRRSSNTFFRIYDKQLETKFKIGQDIDPCTRWELEAKHENADNFAKMIIETGNLAVSFFQVLSNSFRIKLS